MRWLPILLLAALLAAGCERGQEASAETVTAQAPQPLVQLGPWLAQEAAAGRFSGAVLVARGDTVLFRQAYGLADRAAGAPLTPDARFRIASISKQFTAAAVLQLQDRGVLSVEDPVCRWITPCPEAWRGVTLHHLLSHTSGVPDLMDRPDWSKRRWAATTPTELTAAAALLPLEFAPGERAGYSNAGYNLLGAVVERATGRPFHQHLRAALLDPLGLKNTGYDDGRTPLVVGYAAGADGPVAQRASNAGVVFAAGGLFSSLDDLGAWTRALHGGRVLSPRSYAQMIAATEPERYRARERSGVSQAYGYGLFLGAPGRWVEPGFDDRQIFHTGSWAGFRALVSYQPDARVTVVVLSNDFEQGPAVTLAAQRAMAEALGRPLPLEVRRASTAPATTGTGGKPAAGAGAR
jgi:CubicO group peptidase (beta-lactamase class C family)